MWLSLFGPARRLLQCSDLAAIEAKADVASPARYDAIDPLRKFSVHRSGKAGRVTPTDAARLHRAHLARDSFPP